MKIENLLRLRRIENTLRSTGKPAAIYLADDLNAIIVEETGGISYDQTTKAIMMYDLSSEELDALRAGRYIEAIKMVRWRKKSETGTFDLKAAKDFVDAAAEKLGFYNPNPGPGELYWKVPPK